jgi:hypothetical protein
VGCQEGRTAGEHDGAAVVDTEGGEVGSGVGSEGGNVGAGTGDKEGTEVGTGVVEPVGTTFPTTKVTYPA